MTLKLITMENCQNCDYVKGKIQDDADIKIIDVKSVEAMTLLAYNELLGDHNKTKFPVLILDDHSAMTGVIKIKNEIIRNNGGD